MKPIDEFLETLDAQLNDLPPARRIEIIGETRAHLEAMIAARRAGGQSEAQAWQSAREAFGDAKTTGAELAREWKRAPRVETEGTPLSRREKIALLTPFLVRCFAVWALVLLSFAGLGRLSSANQGLILIAWIPLIFGFQLRRQRGKGRPITPSRIAWFGGAALLSLGLGIYQQFESELHGTSTEIFLQAWAVPLFMLTMAAILFWAKLEARHVFPWRYLPRYPSNPIGAEQEYFLWRKIETAFKLLLAFTFWSWMGWQFLGFVLAAILGLGEIAFTLLYARWQNGKIR